MAIYYEASSLEDIAKAFDERAEKSAIAASHASTKRAQSISAANSRTWTQAAEMLRATTLKLDKPD